MSSTGTWPEFEKDLKGQIRYQTTPPGILPNERMVCALGRAMSMYITDSQLRWHGRHELDLVLI